MDRIVTSAASGRRSGLMASALRAPSPDQRRSNRASIRVGGGRAAGVKTVMATYGHHCPEHLRRAIEGAGDDLIQKVCDCNICRYVRGEIGPEEVDRIWNNYMSALTFKPALPNRRRTATHR